jgi:superoxide reductase
MGTKNIGEVYKCEVCGNTISVLEVGGGTLVCCGQNMTLLKEKTVKDEGKEKHVPVITISGKNVTVKVGSIPHPMESAHYIELIQLMKGNEVIMGKRLKPKDKPEATFCVEDSKGLKARILCNIHGLWVSG